MFIPDPNFSFPDPESRVKKIPWSRIRIRNKKFKYLKVVSKLSEIWSGMLIPNPDFLPIPDPGSRGQKDTGSRISDPDPQHCFSHSLSSLLCLSHSIRWIFNIFLFSIPASTYFPSNLASDQPVEPSNNHAPTVSSTQPQEHCQPVRPLNNHNSNWDVETTMR